MNAMFLSGLLYRKLDRGEIGKLQMIVSEFSANGEQFITSQLNENKEALERCTMEGHLDLWTSDFKQRAVAHIHFWEKKSELPSLGSWHSSSESLAL